MKYAYFTLVGLVLLFSNGCRDEATAVYTTEFAELDSIIGMMESDLKPLEGQIQELASQTEYLFDHQDRYAAMASRDEYKISDAGVIYRESADKSESSVHVSSISQNREEVFHQIYFTEALDSAFRTVYADTPLVAQVYFNTRLQLCRIYPSLDALQVFDTDADLTSFNFYYMADEVRNPEKKSKWVEDIYVDPAGRGWILSLIHPVYHQGQLEGVMGFDITINDIIQRFLKKSDKKLLIIDGSGNIVAGTNDAIEMLNLPPLRNHTYIQTINSDNFRKEDYNLFKSKSKEVRKMVAKFLLEKDNVYKMEDDFSSQKYTVYCRQMNLLNWYILEVKR
ncbi:cache domain-containing protein [Echinicola vietnamensis]|uniref:Putative cysteine protease (OTU family) n=1 Tax=Echinicola vietnamensis (strain DSM 17526 / LMG 23754 / KMM 6221) TaxID=926556 RepID=L0G103_ECHVK|nr:cache domain-containing protein [Echinicola vietnamensis]AGA78691.1 putative cysteine protease (OTU family) [Echinicola vietnamensis DSM 17526]